jgi:hypothetical protein
MNVLFGEDGHECIFQDELGSAPIIEKGRL